jgi:subtilisin family serine protease
MSKDKITDAFRDAVKGRSARTQVSAILRTRTTEADAVAVAKVQAMAEQERLATSGADLLPLVSRRPGRGQAFLADLENATKDACARLVDAAPQAHELWLAGAVAVTGSRKEIEDLAGHEDVVSVDANPTFEVPKVLRTPLEDTPDNVDGGTWGLAKIRAPGAWAFGKGENVLIGHLDTGVDDSHPALSGKVAAFQEFDALGNPVASATHDSGSHGTHTAGTLVGRSFNGTNLGVAPKAHLASALVLPGGSGTFAQIVAGMQWAIAQGAHIISMSLGGSGYTTLWNLPVLNATIAGVLVVASIGNSGQGTSGGPGNDFLTLGVGATGDTDAVAGFSSGQTLVGVPWFGSGLTYIKPDISAPGVGVLSSVPGNAVASFNGTSMACPHVAGTAALLMSAEPTLRGNPLLTRAVLLSAGREDFGEAGRDQRYGFGRLDARAAAEQCISLL